METRGIADQLDADIDRLRGGLPVPAPVTLLLSVTLRQQTACLHRQTEELLGLPGAVRSRDDYCAWLGRFLGLYEPVEQSLARFTEWNSFGIARPSCGHSASIANDLAALAVDPASVVRAPHTLLPVLPTFAHALGALYVLEGATLGGRLILRDINARIGDQIAGATQFFGGDGDGLVWHRFRGALDVFGTENRLLHADAVTGAERVFRAILAWFTPFRDAGVYPR